LPGSALKITLSCFYIILTQHIGPAFFKKNVGIYSISANFSYLCLHAIPNNTDCSNYFPNVVLAVHINTLFVISTVTVTFHFWPTVLK